MSPLCTKVRARGVNAPTLGKSKGSSNSSNSTSYALCVRAHTARARGPRRALLEAPPVASRAHRGPLRPSLTQHTSLGAALWYVA